MSERRILAILLGAVCAVGYFGAAAAAIRGRMFVAWALCALVLAQAVAVFALLDTHEPPAEPETLAGHEVRESDAEEAAIRRARRVLR